MVIFGIDRKAWIFNNQDMKEKIERLAVLLKEVSDIKQELNDLVKETAKEYVKYERKKYPCFDYPNQDDSFDDWDFTSNGFVYFNWDEYWAYGGHASGTISFPIAFLSDKEAFDKFKADCVESEQERLKEESDREHNKKVAEYERLKKELFNKD